MLFCYDLMRFKVIAENQGLHVKNFWSFRNLNCETKYSSY